MEEPHKKVEAKVEHNSAIIKTNIVITTPVVALNPENKVLQTKEGILHLTQEEPVVKEQRLPKDQGLSG